MVRRPRMKTKWLSLLVFSILSMGVDFPGIRLPRQSWPKPRQPSKDAPFFLRTIFGAHRLITCRLILNPRPIFLPSARYTRGRCTLGDVVSEDALYPRHPRPVNCFATRDTTSPSPERSRIIFSPQDDTPKASCTGESEYHNLPAFRRVWFAENRF